MTKEIQPIDRLQHIFNDVLEDLAATTRRVWDSDNLTGIARETLEESLAAKIASYQSLYGLAMELTAQQLTASIITQQEPLDLEPCDFCDGQGKTPTPFLEGFDLPCINCDGSGQVIKEGTGHA